MSYLIACSNQEDVKEKDTVHVPEHRTGNGVGAPKHEN